MNQSCKIRDDLYFTRVQVADVAKKQVVLKLPRINHIWIYDRSGSMYSLLSELAEDLIRHSKTLMTGDTLTIGWFSTEGQFNWLLKGHQISPDSFSVIEDMINRNKTTIGLTCFSDILLDTENVIRDVSSFGNTFSFIFFTDGYPVVSNYQHEIDKIFYAISKISGSISSSLFVGYGAYYNKSLMSKMADKMGSSLIHSSKLQEFTNAATMFLARRKATPRRQLFIPFLSENVYAAYTVDQDGSVSLYDVDPKLSYVLAPEDTSEIFLLTKTQPSGQKWKTIPAKYIHAGYAAAMVMNQKVMSDMAMDILSKIGDVALVQSIADSWTNDEYGRAESLIQLAMISPRSRFQKGKKVGYGASSNTICLLDIISMLVKDEYAKVHPFDAEFRYKRTGVKRTPKPGYPKFEHKDDLAVPFESLTWNESRLNLSMLLNIPGWIMLNDDYQSHGFNQRTFRTFVWRNYTIIKDGILNVPVIPMELGEESFYQLYDDGALDDAWYTIPREMAYVPENVYNVHLDKYPLMNRDTANLASRTTAAEVCQLEWEMLESQAMSKVARFMRDELDVDGKSKEITGYTPEQSEYLLSLGITKSGFAPPTDEQGSTDFYYATEFIIGIEGYSSLPSVNKVKEKTLAGKNLTPSENLIQKSMREIELGLTGFNNNDDKIKYLDWSLKMSRKRSAYIRGVIASIKFSIIMAKRWFSDLSQRDGAVVTDSAGHKFKFSIRDIQVEY